MKIIDIAWKDILRALRNLFFLGFGIGVPVLMGGIFYFAFGGMASDNGLDIPQTDVIVVDLDEPDAAFGGFAVGQLTVDALAQNESLFKVTEMDEAAAAREAVDNQEADVAVIIPAGFTAAAFDPDGEGEIEIYQDPTLILGPGIVKGFVGSIVDAFAGASIAVKVTDGQLSEQGIDLDQATLWQVYAEYGGWAQELGESQQAGTGSLFTVQSPLSGEEKDTNAALAMIGGVMMGMMVFYAFFTGASSAQNILQEEENGTLGRLFTTPTSISAILGGKFVSVFALVVVQVLVLIGFSSLIFKTQWGAPIPLALAAIGLVVVASSFGIFIMSFLKDTKQTGIVIGGVMTVLGMAGISSVFTSSVPGASGGIAQIIPLFTPQGWAMRAWELAYGSGGIGDVLVPFAVCIGLGIVSFLVGVYRFKRRFG
jgi:ABC-2 type transport system permease protein